MAEEKQEGQKTVVSFIVGLLIGGLLVWAFSGPVEEPKDEESTDTPKEQVAEDNTNNKGGETEETKTTDVVETEVVKATLPVGEGKISVADQAASLEVKLDSATYPVSEGWVGVRDYSDGKLGGLLGVVRFSEEPSQIVLQRATKSGNEYAVVVYKENGDRQFNLAEDAQVGEVYSTFTAK
jgi:hypothetical protein